MTEDEENRLRCERECTRLCHDFAWTVDHGDYDAFVDLFAPDGVFERAGHRSEGHGAIRAFLDARPAGRTTRHVCSNIRADLTGADTARGHCIALMYAGAGTDVPLQVSAPMLVDYADEFVLTARGWKFLHRRTDVIFQP
jgi:uncharacterized protein (TIGR02246 family)